MVAPAQTDVPLSDIGGQGPPAEPTGPTLHNMHDAIIPVESRRDPGRPPTYFECKGSIARADAYGLNRHQGGRYVEAYGG